MKRFCKLLYDNKLFIVMMIILYSYVGTIHSDYIVQDAFIEQNGEYISVTSDTPVRTNISLTKQNGFRSFLLSILKPSEASGEYTTTFRIFRNEDVVYEYSMNNDADIEINDVYGNATEFVLDEVIKSEKGKEYSIEVTSTAPDVSRAFSLASDESGGVWSRLTYLLLTKDERKIIVFLSVFLLAAVVYFMFIKQGGGIF